MKILILGGNGFIGSNIGRIISENEEVYSFDLKIPDNKIEGVHYLEGDYFDLNVLKKVVNGMDVVIHAISLLNPSNSAEKYEIGYVKELPQLLNLCQILAEKKIKLIFLSSGGTVYGESDKQPISEKMSTNPINHYGSVKVCMENVIRTFVKQNGLMAYVARVSNPYGCGQDYRRGVGFIDAVVRNALNQDVIQVWGDGGNIRDYIYIDDVCNMIYSLCKYNGDIEVFNVSTGVGVSQNEIIAYVSQLLGKVQVEYISRRSVDARTTILNNTEIMKVYDKKITTIQDGIAQYIKYMREILNK